MTLLSDAMTYAFRGSGKYMLVLVAVISIVADLASLAPAIGGIAKLILIAYICSLYFEVIQTTATGGYEVPEFPEISNLFEDLISPMLQTIMVIVFSFSPLLAYAWLGPPESSDTIPLLLMGIGAIYLPMAMLAVVVLGRLSALSPHIVLPAIVRAGWLYWASAFMILFLIMTEAYVNTALGSISFLTYPLTALIGTYALLTNGRLLGIIYREREEKLNWL